MIVIPYYFIIIYNTTMSSASKTQIQVTREAKWDRARVKRMSIAVQPHQVHIEHRRVACVQYNTSAERVFQYVRKVLVDDEHSITETALREEVAEHLRLNGPYMYWYSISSISNMRTFYLHMK
jgi:hypothetical protein